MEIGIVGLPKSGKTTLFNALTGMDAAVSAFASGAAEPNVAVVKVPDPRVDKLAELHASKKTTYATIKYVDLAGVAADKAEKSHGLPEGHLRHLSQTDALLAVIRAFEDESGAAPDPAGDLDTIEMELLLSDMQTVENRLPRIEKSMRNAKGPEAAQLNFEQSALLKMKERLDEERPLRGIQLTPEEDKAIRGLQWLSLKPLLVVFNVAEDAVQSGEDLSARFTDRWQPGLMAGAQLCAAVEMEIAQLDPEERETFLADYGIEEPAADKVVRLSYEMLGLISFLTAGEKEARAWTVRRGATAPEAAGAIHSDLQRGFIRAETVHYDDLIGAGSLPEAKKQGLTRLEGKNYVVKDGDVLDIRFSV